MIHKGGEWIIGFVLFMGIAIAVLIHDISMAQGVSLEFWGLLIVANLFTAWGNHRSRQKKQARLQALSETLNDQTSRLKKLLKTLDGAGRRG